MHPSMREQPPGVREPTGPAVRASPTAARRALRRAALAGAAALFLSLSGAFGSGGAPWTLRLLYWLLAIGGGTLIAGVAAARVNDSRWSEGGLWRPVALVTALATPPIALLAWALYAAMFARGRLEPALLPGFVLPAGAVTAVLALVTALVERRPVMTHATPIAATPAAPVAPTSATPVAARLLDRLPPRLRGAELHAVEAEDHYLRLHTSRGSDLVLMRLADALGELEGIEGARTHRSWWVARAAVQGAERGDGRAVLRLPGGLEAPVSRTYAPALREAGWF